MITGFEKPRTEAGASFPASQTVPAVLVLGQLSVCSQVILNLLTIVLDPLSTLIFRILLGFVFCRPFPPLPRVSQMISLQSCDHL